MSEKDLAGIDNVEVEPLSDGDLETVAGGTESDIDFANNSTGNCTLSANTNSCCKPAAT